MFIVCFIHSFWTCGNQNLKFNYTFCCLCGTGSGQMLWWWQQLSWKVGINLLAVLYWYFSPVDNFSPCKASFSTLILFAARARGNLSPACFHSPETLHQIILQTAVMISASWAPSQIYLHSFQPSSPLLLCFTCLTGYLHAASSVSFCLPVIALVIMTNTRRGLFAPLYVVSSCRGCDWAERADKSLWSVGQKFRLGHKQLHRHCSLLWLRHHSTLVSHLGASFSFSLEWSSWAKRRGVIHSHMPPGLQNQYMALEVRLRLPCSRPETHCSVSIMQGVHTLTCHALVFSNFP